MSKTKFIVGAVTDVGLQRVNNEDNFFVPTIPVKSRDKKVFSISTSHPNGLEIENTNAFLRYAMEWAAITQANMRHTPP